MKIDEFKKKIQNKAFELIDVYYNDNDIIDRMTNSTLKVMLNANIDKMDNVLSSFVGNDGEINTDTIIKMYADNIPSDGVNFNIKRFIKSDFINSILPDKCLNITKEDVKSIFV